MTATCEAAADPTAGRNVRSVWEIATQPYPEAHFATFPEALPERCIKAGTSERGCCPVCGAPWVREVERERRNAAARSNRRRGDGTRRHGRGVDAGCGACNYDGTTTGWRPSCDCDAATTGWRPSCDHDRAPVPCTVLDPFMGSGTVALVARKLGRRSDRDRAEPRLRGPVRETVAAAVSLFAEAPA